MSRKLTGNNEKANKQFAFFPSFDIDKNKGDLSFKNYVNPVPREEANIEAEKGETMITPMGDTGLTKTVPKTYIIKGKKHSKGGTPLNVPDDTFLYSDYLKNTNEDVHKMFGKPFKKSGYTYAELSKPFMLNDDLANLVNPHSDRLTRETAEKNIQNKIDKLSLLSILQESEKGFKTQDGQFDLPKIAMPFIEKSGIDLATVADPFLKEVSPLQETPQFKHGGAYTKYEDGGDVSGSIYYDEDNDTYYDEDGYELEVELPKHQNGESVKTKKKVTKKTVNPKFSDITDSDKETKEYKALFYNAETEDELKKAEAEYKNYRYVENKLNNDPKFLQSIIEEAQKAASDEKNLGKNFKKNPAAIKELQELMKDPEKIKEAFLNMQLKNAGFSIKNDLSNLQNSPDKGGFSNDTMRNGWSKTYWGKEPNYAETVLGQAAYIGYTKAVQKSGHKDLGYKTIGVTGEKENVSGKGDAKDISPIDGVWTNTTIGQRSLANAYDEIIEENIEEPGKPADAPKKYTSTQSPAPIPQGWTAPDTMQLWGAANEIYADTPQQPWNAIPQAVTPNAYVMDPTNMAFNIRGQQAKAMDTVGSYTGLQAATSAASGMTGANDITQAIANVENQNVGIINQHEASNANIINQNNQIKAQLATNLHDKWAQLKDNMQARKAAAKQNFRNAYAQGWQNSVDIALSNAMSDQFAITPWDGNLIFKGGKELTGDEASTDVLAAAQKAIQENPNIDPDLIVKYYLGTDSKSNSKD